MSKASSGESIGLSERHAVFCEHPLERPNYFTGQLLTADDLRAEQEYHRTKQRRHNLHCHGVGVVDGLQVSVTNEKGGAEIVVKPGTAIDGNGNEVHLCTATAFPLRESMTAIQVGIQFSERLCGSTPVPGVGPGEPDKMPARVQEGCEIVLEPLPATRSIKAGPPREASTGVLPLAHVIRRGHSWRLERRFKVPRAC